MRKWLLVVIVGVFVAAAYAPPAYAQNAQIMGRVTDSSSGVMPGVTVTVKNEATGLGRTEVSDAAGNYRLVSLPVPGPYTITVEIQGFNRESREHITLGIDQTATLDFVLKPATVSETVTVTGASAVVDVTTATPQTALTTQQMQDLPVAARRWMDMAMLTPGTSQDSIRGQYYRGNVSVGAGATNFYSTGNLVDGVSNTWAAMGEPRQNFPMDAIEQFNVSVSTYKAEYSLATGGIVNVVTKSGTNDLHFGGFLFHRDQALTAKQYFQTSNPPYLRNQEGGTIGGPVVRDRLHYFFTFERTDENVYNTVSTPAWPQYSGTYLSAQYRWTYLGRGDWQLSPRQTLFARFAKEYEYRPELTVGGSTIPSASIDFSVPRTSFVVGHTWIMSPHTMNDFRFNYAYAKYEVSPPGSHGGWEAGYFGPDRTSWCTPTFTYPSLKVGGCGSSQMGSDHRFEVKDNFSREIDLAGRHEWKAGFDVFYNPLNQDTIGNLLGTWTFPLDKPYDPANPATFPTQYTQSLPSFSTLPSGYYALFVQDDWQPARGLTFNLGLRYDQQPGEYGEWLTKNLASTAAVLGPQAGQFPLPIPFIDEAARGHVKNFGPRIGIAWDPFNDGRMNLHAAWGVYYDHMRGYPGKGELEWPQSQPIVINRPAFPDPLSGQSRSVYLSTAPPNISVNSNSLRNPYAHPINVGVTRELMRGVAVTADFTSVNRFADNNGPNLDINLPDPVTRLRPYPQFGRVSVYASNMQTTYRALFLKVDKRLSNRWSSLVSYTLSSAHDVPISNVQGSVYGFVPVDGYSTADRRHVLRASGTAQLPWNLQVSAILDLRSSQTFNPATALDINKDGYTIDLPPGVGFNSGCRDLNLDAVNTFRAASGLSGVTSVACPGYQNIDLRFSKFIPFRNHRVDLIAQLFNITNHANFASPTSNPLSATFGQVNQIAPYINAPSRQAEVAIRFQF